MGDVSARLGAENRWLSTYPQSSSWICNSTFERFQNKQRADAHIQPMIGGQNHTPSDRGLFGRDCPRPAKHAAAQAVIGSRTATRPQAHLVCAAL